MGKGIFTSEAAHIVTAVSLWAGANVALLAFSTIAILAAVLSYACTRPMLRMLGLAPRDASKTRTNEDALLSHKIPPDSPSHEHEAVDKAHPHGSAAVAGVRKEHSVLQQVRVMMAAGEPLNAARYCSSHLRARCC